MCGYVLGMYILYIEKKRGWSRFAFAMVLGRGEMDWNIVSCNASVFIELLDAHFFTHNDWVKTSFHFIKNGGSGRVLPLQWFSVVVKWFEILLIAMHPPSSNYWMLIFPPTTTGWNPIFILYFCWLVFFLYSFIFSFSWNTQHIFWRYLLLLENSQ